MKPTVLMVHSNAELYGADLILLHVAQGLARDANIIVALPCDGPLAGRLRACGIEVVLTHDSILRRINLRPTRLPGWAIGVLVDTYRLFRLARRRRIALVYSNTAAVVTGVAVAKLCRIPHVYHVHEIIVKPLWFAKLIARVVTSGADEVIAVSGPVREQLLKYGRSQHARVVVIHNGIDPPATPGDEDRKRAREELGAAPGDVLFAVVGRIHPWKGQGYFLKAARLVADRHPLARFAIVGGTFAGNEYLLDELRALIDDGNMRNRCRILPFRDDIPAVMAALDVFVLPSTLPDPLPTVVLEAMAAGRPVVATAHGGALEMVVDGVTGLLAPWDDQIAFAEALGRLAGDAALRAALGRAGRLRQVKHFSRVPFIESIREVVRRHLPEITGEALAARTQSS